MSKDVVQTFLDDYEELYTRTGSIGDCGREDCTDLILSAQRVCPRADFGKAQYGSLNQGNIDMLYIALRENKRTVILDNTRYSLM